MGSESSPRLTFRDATPDVAIIAGLQNAAADGGAGPFYARCGFQERGRVIYRSNPLAYYELLLEREG